MRVIAYYDNWFAKLLKVGAITLYPFVLFAMKREAAFETAKHECVHVRQVRRLGWFGFYWAYLVDYCGSRVRGANHNAAYLAIKFEAEAYETSAAVVLTDEERKEFGL